MKFSMTGVQHLGRSLMLPIAVLPVAGLLLRLGQPDLLDIAFISSAGDAIFSNLGLLFAIGVAVGFARENHGAAGLAGVVAFLVATSGAKTLIAAPEAFVAGLDADAVAAAVAAYKDQAIAKMGVPVGILCGVIAGVFYNRFGNIKLPEYLAFFGGRRFVPIISGCAALVLAILFGYGWGAVEAGMDTASRAIVDAGGVGLFIYGVLNRILIVTGLHHILNNAAWFIIGDYEGVTGDLRRFFAGDPTAGSFMAGFFPVMMFGLPAACFAMYRAAAPDRRAEVGGLYLSMALTSFLTGITEPIEFTFMFLAPVLYAVHAVLTGLSMFLTDFLGVRLGFGFSAGLFDYVLNFNKATHPLYLIPIGALYFALYYMLFSLCIRMMNLKTPGREPQTERSIGRASTPGEPRAAAIIDALGGKENLVSVSACTTRLRLIVKVQGSVDEAALKRLGAKGMIRPSSDALQVVLGPTAELVASEITAALGSEVSAAPISENTPTTLDESLDGKRAESFLTALGGAINLDKASALGGRLCIMVRDVKKVNEKALAGLAPRSFAFVGGRTLHILMESAGAKQLAAALKPGAATK